MTATVASSSNTNNANASNNKSANTSQKTSSLLSPTTNTTIMTQSPSNNSLAMANNNEDLSTSLSSNNSHKTGNANPASANQTAAGGHNNTNNNAQPKRQRSCDLIDSRTLTQAGGVKTTQPVNKPPSINNPIKYLSPNTMLYSPSNTTSNGLLLSTSGGFNNTIINLKTNMSSSVGCAPQMKKSLSNMQNHQQSQGAQAQQPTRPLQVGALQSPGAAASSPAASTSTEETRNGEQLNILLDPAVINDYPTQALLLTVLATLVRNSTDENEIRVLYSYIAEASIVFSKVFPVIHNLLDSKINHILQLSLDESILDSVQSIIQNMISSEYMSGTGSGSGGMLMNDSSYQQQLSYLQVCLLFNFYFAI
jgi:hypothetical protein